ncbi:MAG: hypothetical protein AAGF31_01695 [Planctomycetota bacterium]
MTPLHDCVRAWGTEQDRLGSELDESLSALEAFQRQLESWQTQLASERDTLESEQADWAAEQRSSQELTAEAEELQQQIDRLQTEATQREAEQGTATSEIAELRATLVASEQREQELSTQLDKQRQAFADQQARWDEDFRRMRELLDQQAAEGLAEVSLAEPQESGAASAAVDPVIEDPVLDSVLAQFGKLRQQQAGRRAGAT